MTDATENTKRGPSDSAPTVSSERVARTGETEREDAKTGKIPDVPERPREIGGPPGPEPTRYGDWEKKGRCIDF
ncbi:MAG: DUF1674 domain-containing protein [Gammaproteobacteria bacterium]